MAVLEVVCVTTHFSKWMFRRSTFQIHGRGDQWRRAGSRLLSRSPRAWQTRDPMIRHVSLIHSRQTHERNVIVRIERLNQIFNQLYIATGIYLLSCTPDGLIYQTIDHRALLSLAIRMANPRKDGQTFSELEVGDSCGSTRDVEPLVNARVDRSRSLVLTPGDIELTRIDAVGAMRHGGVFAGTISSV